MTDLTHHTPDELNQMVADASAELGRRSIVAGAPQRLNNLLREVDAAGGDANTLAAAAVTFAATLTGGP